MRFTISLLLLLVLLSLNPAWARFRAPDIVNVPVDRVITNIEKRLAKKPGDRWLVYSLARVHAMAYAQRATHLNVDRGQGGQSLDAPPRTGPPYQVRFSANVHTEKRARAHLRKSVKLFGELVKAHPDDALYRLGYGWVLEEAKSPKAAIREYRAAMKSDSGGGFGKRPGVEAGESLLKLLPKDHPDRKKIEARIKELENQPRKVTPLVLPLAQCYDPELLVDRQASVPFDLDGSGRRSSWEWITPKAGWLVYDPHKSGRVTSALQMFGSVTFWNFWPNGYEALSVLDDDLNGELVGAELAGLAIWQDLDSDGVSDPGEVKPLADWGVVALSTRWRLHRSGIPYSPAGARLSSGLLHPTFDLNFRAR